MKELLLLGLLDFKNKNIFYRKVLRLGLLDF
jgi:hypothetical protein